jgi:DNA polymerase elongation subunit (family B)
MSLEGVYRRLVFLPSKVKSTRPVAARFYGVFAGGGMKIRGPACRRRDTPQFIKEAQDSSDARGRAGADRLPLFPD